MWQEFWKLHAHLVSFLDPITLKRDITGEVVAVNIPRVWAEPIPGMQSLNLSLIDYLLAYLTSIMPLLHACHICKRGFIFQK